MRPPSCSEAGRNWAVVLRNYQNTSQRSLQSNGRRCNRSNSCGATYSYSSTGSAFGWAISATATDPPPYVVDCRARMSTFSISTGTTEGSIRCCRWWRGDYSKLSRERESDDDDCLLRRKRLRALNRGALNGGFLSTEHKLTEVGWKLHQSRPSPPGYKGLT